MSQRTALLLLLCFSSRAQGRGLLLQAQSKPGMVTYSGPTTAPDTCSAYYWDPLLSATEGDGMAWEVGDSSGGDSSGGDSLAPIIGGSVGGAALILIVLIVLLILYRAKKKGNHEKEREKTPVAV